MSTEENVWVCHFCFCGDCQANFDKGESSFCVWSACSGETLPGKVKARGQVCQVTFLDNFE